MRIEQYEDKNLSHYSYLIEDNGEMMIIDPSRNPMPYFDAARSFEAQIKGVILTHRHADFVSSHAEIHQKTGATIYIHQAFPDAQFPHQKLEDQACLQVGSLQLTVLHTPGHTPDSICILIAEEGGNSIALFTGDTLFIGDCGRPDLFESTHSQAPERQKEFAVTLFKSLQRIKQLEDTIYIYPGHGAGSLCGKQIVDDDRSTISEEKISNWSLQPQDEKTFIEQLLSNLPFIPAYFEYNQALNAAGAPLYQESIDKVQFLRDINSEDDLSLLISDYPIIDTRHPDDFKKARLENSINIPNGKQFETWLGSIIKPYQPFYLAGDDIDTIKELIERSAKIGYEAFIKNALLVDYGVLASPKTRLDDIKEHPVDYTILDVRSGNEVQEQTFPGVVNIPLEELQERLSEIPLDKPIVVHCAGGYRSAIASSILERHLKETQLVMDVGTAIKGIIDEHH